MRPGSYQRVPFEETLSKSSFRVGKLDRSEYRSAGPIPIVDQGQAEVAGFTSRHDLAYQGPLPVVVFGDHTRTFKLVTQPFVAGADGTKVLVPDVDRFEPPYYFFAQKSLNIASKGYNGHYAVLREQSIPLPSLDEQRSIVKVLSAIQRAIDAERAWHSSIQMVRDQAIRALIGRGAEWPHETVGGLFEIQLGKMLSPRARLGIRSRPYLRNQNVQWGRIDTSDLAEMDFDEREEAKFDLLPGDLLVCEGGEIGRCATWGGAIPGCSFQKAIMRLRPRAGRMLPEFLLYHLWRAFRLDRIYGDIGSRSTIAHLPAVKMASLSVAVPPMHEQRVIVQSLSGIGVAIEASRHRLAKLSAVFQSAMAYLFGSAT